jgi:PAS domain S-box-containing protein
MSMPQTKSFAIRQHCSWIFPGILLLVALLLWWTFAGGSAFEKSTGILLSAALALICILLCFMIRQQGKKYQQALILAQEMTAKLETAKKKADDLNRKTELILNSAGEGIIGLDIDGRSIFANSAATQMLGFQPDELQGQFAHIITHHTHSHDSADEIENCPIHLTLKDGRAHEKEEDIFWRKDGTSFPVKYASTPIREESGQLAGIVVTFNDITEHLRAEKDRCARQVADQANKAKSAFLAHMSHEIRTPMNAVLGCAQILLGDRSFSSRQIELLQTIERAGGHLLSLFNDILDISKIEAGQVTLNETVFSLPDLLEEMKAIFRLAAENKGLRFFMDYSENSSRYILADNGKLRQILVNLLGNAIKFTEQGSVVLRAHTDILQHKTLEVPEKLHLLFEIEDTGPGIRQEDLGKIFIPFEQTAVKSSGTGLGLPISNQLVQLMGGKLTVESKPGQGCRFRFHVQISSSEIDPQQEMMEPQGTIERGPRSGTTALRVLVVDDSDTNRIYLRSVLEMNHFEVIEAANGQEAINCFEQHIPDAVLMDVQMPLMDGLEATRRLKATDKGRLTPIIAITGNACEENQQQCLEAGMDSYLCKPFTTTELLGILGKHLGLGHDLQLGSRDRENTAPSRVPPLSANNFTMLPTEILTALQMTIEEGDIGRLRQLITRIQESDADTALGLQALADQYNYAKISDLLEQGKKGRNDHEQHNT